MKYLPARNLLLASVAVVAALSLFPKDAFAAQSVPNQPLSAETGPNPGQVTLKWSHIYSDVQNYNIVYGTEAGNYQYGAIGIGKTTSYTVNFLKPGVKYYFAISPVKGGKAQFISSPVSGVSQVGVVTPPPSQPVSTAPVASPADRNFEATLGDKPGQVKLKWRRVASEDNFHVVYGTKPGKYQFSALNVGQSGSFTVGALNPGEKYYFALIPLKGRTPQPVTSEVASLAKPGVPEESQTQATQQTPVGGGLPQGVGTHQLSVKKGKKPGSVELNWKRAEGEENYHVVYGTKPGKFEYGALNVGKNGSFTVSQLKPGQTYYFALAPIKGGKAQYITEQVSVGASGGGQGSSSSSSGGSQSSGTGTGGSTQTTSGGSGSTNTTTTTTTKNNDNKTNNKKVKGWRSVFPFSLFF